MTLAVIPAPARWRCATHAREIAVPRQHALSAASIDAGDPTAGRSAAISDIRGDPRDRDTRVATDGKEEPLANPQQTAVSSYSRSEEHTSELQSLMRISYAVFCLKKKKQTHTN